MYQHTSKKDILNFFTRFKGKEAPQNKKPWKPIPRFRQQSKTGGRVAIAIFITFCVALTYLLF